MTSQPPAAKRLRIYYRYRTEISLMPPPQERSTVVYATDTETPRADFERRHPDCVVESVSYDE